MAMPLNHPTPRLRIHLLGDLQLTFDGAPLGGKLYGKVLALMAYLCMEAGRSQTRERLAELLWPELTMEAARSNLRQALYYLRQALGGEGEASAFVVAGREAVRFAPESSHWLDVREFSDLPRCMGRTDPDLCARCITEQEQRAALYRGDFIADVKVPDAPEFEAWRETRREALHREMLALLERLSRCHQRQGHLDRALLHARRYTEMEPWDEAGHRRVMGLLAAAGQLGGALAQYENCRAMLQRELGVAPEPLTTELFQQIRDRQAAPAANPVPSPPDTPRTTERRQVTVLYASLSVPAEADPDEAAARLLASHRRCLELMRHLGAHVGPSHGGTVLAYFGYPAAFEDAARRAVRAALAMAAVRASGVGLRIGVHTGVIITAPDSQQPDPAGLASKIALRLCDRAQSDGVVISDATQRLVAGFFHMEPLEAIPLAESTQPIRAFRVTGETGASSRIDAAARLLPLVGRRGELERLKALWEETWRGRGRRVVLRGEAGMGKSRLVRALRESLAGHTWSIREIYCLPEYQQTPLHPVVALLERLLAFGADDTPARRRELVDAYLRTYHPALRDEAYPLILELLEIAEQASALPPEEQRLQCVGILLRLLADAAARQPLLLVVEDLHWVDHSTLALLEMAAKGAGDTPVLTVITTRPDCSAAGLTEDALVMDLAPLSDEEMTTLVNEVVADLPQDVIQRIVARADGVPLFAEEMAYMAAENAQRLEIPSTLQYLLLARLDALGAARTTAQVAATAGREFDRDLLSRVLETAASLDEDLHTLEEARLVIATGESGSLFQFRHALIQETAYQFQARADRQRAHASIAHALITHFPQRAAHQPEQVARHLAASGAGEQAIPWWLAAARMALRASALPEAVEHLRTALDQVADLPPGPARDTRELELLLPLGQALLHLRGYGSADAAATYDRAMALCREDVAPALLFETLWGQWMVSSSRECSSFTTSAGLARALTAVAERTGNPVHRSLAHAAGANVALWQGELETACTEATAAQRAVRAPARLEERLDGHDPVVTSYGYLAWARFAQGRVREALIASEEGVARARSIEHPDSLGFALIHAAIVRRLMRDIPACAALAQEANALAERYNLPLWRGAAATMLGWARVATGDRGGIEWLQASAAAARQVMPGVLNGFLHPLAEALGMADDPEGQLQVTEEGLAAAARLSEHFHLPELHRLRGEALWRLDRRTEARAALAEALRISAAQGAHAFRLRAAVSLGTVLVREGARQEAAQCVQPLLAAWDEAEPLPELAAARKLVY
jgi:DNA-binding SARP family transcriptional activator/predicted negative regulator of RcsB-dependent stress response